MAKPGALVLPRPSRAYVLALGAVALVVALIPIAYLVLVGLVGWGVYAYAAHAASVITTYPFIGPVLYLAPIVAGLVVIAFTLKPFLARRPPPPPPFSVTREQEPRLFAFIDELCALVDAPAPARIDLDLSANASAGLKGLALRRGDLIISFGLPLAAVLDVQQLAAVLVHELAHCRQGTALRLSRVVVALNTWLARVAYERDAWDEALASGVKSSPLGALLLPAIVCVAAARRVFLWLVLAGHRASMGLSRRMEGEADRLSALVVGSEIATDTLRLVHGLELAVARVDVEIQNALSQRERRLPDDAVACTQVQFEALTVSDWRQLDQQAASVRTARFDSHPAPHARGQAIGALNAPGLLGRSGPARALFDDLGAVGLARTRHAYQHTLALTDGFEVVPAAEFSRQVRATDEMRLTLESFFGSDSVVTLDTLPAPGDAEAWAVPRQSLESALQDVERLRPVAQASQVAFEAAFMQHARLLAARQACVIGASFEAEALGLARDDVLESSTLEEAIARALARNEEQRRRNAADIAPFRQAATSAVAAALAHLAAAAPDATSGHETLAPGEADLLVTALNAFASRRTNLHDAQAHLQGFGFLTSLSRPPDPTDPTAVRGPAELVERAWELMSPLVEALRALPLTPESGSDSRVVECHHAITSIEPHASQAFALLPALYRFHGACLSRLLEALALARAPRARRRDVPAPIPPPAPVSSQPAEPSPAPLTVVPGQSAFRRELLRRRPTLVATPLLVFVNVVAFALTAGGARGPDLPAADMLLHRGAAFRPLVVAGEWWRLFAASFLNAGVFRFLVTMGMLAVIGKTAERVFGGTAFLAYYLVIGTVTALGCVLVSDGLVFVTAPAAVVGLGTATLMVAWGFVAGDRVPDRTGDANRLDFPPETTSGLFLALVLVVIVDLPSDAAFGMYPLAAALGAVLARTTAFDAEFDKPARRYVAALVSVAAVVGSLGVTYLQQRNDFRSEGFAWLAREERALVAFETARRRNTGRGPVAVGTLTPIVDGLLGEIEGAQVRARDMYARYLAVESRNRKLDRYGRNPRWRTWLATVNQLQIGWAYGDYLRSRESTWRARLRYVAEQQPDKLDELNRADVAARWALRNVLLRPESTNPP